VKRKLLASCCLVLLAATAVMAEETSSDEAKGAVADEAKATVTEEAKDAAAEPGAKMISGMSIVGNDEAPKSLFIVPWKSSELGVKTSLNRTLNEREEPVDRDVFMRELDFYEVSTAKSN